MTSAFSFAGGWLNPPIIFLLVLVGVFYIKKGLDYPFQVDTSMLIIIGFLGVIWISFLCNNFIFRDMSSKSIAHLIAYHFSIIFLYLLVRPILRELVSDKDSRALVFKFIMIGVVFSSSFGIVEFVVKNFYGIPLDELLPRSVAADDYLPTILGGKIRMRSFAEESGHFALYLEIIAPLGYCYFIMMQSRSLFKVGYILIVLLAMILTFSSVLYVAIMIALALFGLLPVFYKLIVKLKINLSALRYFVLLSITVIGILVLMDSYYFDVFYDVVFDKVSTGSATDRTDRIDTLILVFTNGNWIQYLFGFSPGAYEGLKIDSIISWIFNIVLETGFLGFILINIFYAIKILYLNSIENNKIRMMFYSSFFMGMFHYIFVGNYWYPWIWILFGLIDGYYFMHIKKKAYV